MTLWRKLIGGLLAILVLYLAILGYMMANSQHQLSTENMCTQTSNSLNQSLQLIEMRLQSYLESITLLSTNQELFYLFTRHETDGFGDNSREKIIRRLINTYFTDQTYLIDLHLISSSINFGYNQLTDYSLFDFGENGYFYPESGANHYARWYPSIAIGQFANVGIRPTSRVEVIRNTPVVRFVRKMHISTVIDDQIILLQDNLDRIYFVLDIQPALFSDILSASLPTEKATYSIIDGHSGVVVGTPLTAEEKAFLDQVQEKLEQPTIVQHKSGHDYLFARKMGITGWLGIVRIPDDAYLTGNPARAIPMMILVSVMVLLAISMFVRRSVKPVETAARKTAELAKELVPKHLSGDKGSEAEIISTSIESINRHIELLIQKNADLARREQESTILSLETQIVPHFLYNALNKIHLEMIERGETEIAARILRLSSVFRYQISSKMHVVFLYQDLHQLEQFTLSMQTEKQKQFTIYYDIASDLYESIVPKMFMQPFVENAIIHGFADRASGGIIQIRGYVEGEMAVYRIQDNGCGIDPEKLKEIMNNDKQRISGCANINQRIKLLFGEEYGVDIVSKQNETIATIRIPLMYEK